MSGNVQQQLNREKRESDFKEFVDKNPHIPVATAIAKFYPNLSRLSETYKRLSRVAAMQREANKTDTP